MKKLFLIEVDFTQDELQETADTYGVSIEQVTNDQVRQCFENALLQEFDDLKVLPYLTTASAS